MEKPIRQIVVEAIDSGQVTATALAQAAEVSYNVIVNLKRRPESSTSAENAAKIRNGLAKLGITQPPDQPTQQAPKGHEDSGLSEPPITPWTPPPRRADGSLLSDLAPSARSPCAFRLTSQALELGYRAGDILVIDLKASATPGDIVLANRIDADTGSGETVLGRLLPPYLAPPAPDAAPVLIDNTLAIMGPVVASFRPQPA